MCARFPGSEPAVPILPHLAFERASDGRIRITGRIEPAGPSTRPRFADLRLRPMPDVPPTRRLLREHAQIIPLEEPPVPEPIPQEVKVSEEPASIIPEEINPVRRFPTPSDTYSPSPSRGPSPVPRSPRSETSGVPLPKPRMEFVYPPKPRPHPNPRHGEGDTVENEVETREFSPGPPWLEKMLVDLELGRKDLLGDLEEAKREVRDALDEITRVHILLEREKKMMEAFVDRLRRVVGDEVVDKIITEGTEAAEARTSDEDEDDEFDQEGGEHDLQSYVLFPNASHYVFSITLF